MLAVCREREVCHLEHTTKSEQKARPNDTITRVRNSQVCVHDDAHDGNLQKSQITFNGASKFIIERAGCKAPYMPCCISLVDFLYQVSLLSRYSSEQCYVGVLGVNGFVETLGTHVVSSTLSIQYIKEGLDVTQYV